MENKALFLEAGGEEYRYIPALNDSDTHIDVLVSVLSRS
jgi:ferrochelatase